MNFNIDTLILIGFALAVIIPLISELAKLDRKVKKLKKEIKYLRIDLLNSRKTKTDSQEIT